MELLIFDQDEQFIASIGTEESGAVVVSDAWDELLGTLQMDLIESEDARVRVSVGMYVAFRDLDNAVQMFEVRDRNHIKDNASLQITRIYAEHVRYEMINDPIEDRRPYNVDARNALDVALEGTRWRIGEIVDTPIGSTNFYYESALSAISKIQEIWGLRLAYRIVLLGNTIVDRLVDMQPPTGRDTGKRFEYGKDITSVRQTVSLSSTVTALYGRGKSEQVSENGYGRKITFEDIVWSKSDGNPADKPHGQKWVGDEDAFLQWNHGGRHRFGFKDFNDIEDPAELLQATWDELQARNKPQISYEMTVVDLERITGYPHEAVRLWDRVRVIDKTFSPPLFVEADVIGIQRSLSSPQNTKITLGNYAPSIINAHTRSQLDLSRLVDKAGAYDRGIWQSVMDLLSTQIISSGTNFFTDPDDGSFCWISDDGNSIVKITGGGILISNQKTGDTWDWRTAISSGHLVIDEQTVGQINAALIKIMGSKGTFWDNNYIQITSQTNPLEIMRYGLYDGVNSGLAFSQDGGITWDTAIGFDGAHFGDKLAGFDINANGLTNGDLIQLMSNGTIRLGGIRMDGGDHPYFSFSYSGMEAFRLSEGSCDVNQTLYANGNFWAKGRVYFTNLPTTPLPPNLRVIDGELHISNWVPSTGGGGTDPGGGGDDGISLSVSWNKSSATVGEQITASVTVQDGSASSFTYILYVNGSEHGRYTTSSRSYSVSTLLAGEYIIEVQATGGSGSGWATSYPCTVTAGGAGGDGSYPKPATTLGTDVNVRSGPGTGYSIVATIPNYGTQVFVTGPVESGWWPVSYNTISGYIRTDYLLIVVG